MGMTSKPTGARLPERPKPPTWEDIAQDVDAAQTDDIVFKVGKDYLPNISGPSSDKIIDTAGGADKDSDPQQADLEKAQESYSNVLRLIESHERLSAAPSSLREQYSQLQESAETLRTTILSLTEIQKSLASMDNTQPLQAKSKPRQKKKK